MHEARKKAKRLRYAAESTVPVLGKRAMILAGATKKVQQALGEHQDTVVARQRLREFGIAWKALPPARHTRRWLKG